MPGAEPIPEIRHASQASVRRDDRRTDRDSIFGRRLAMRLAAALLVGLAATSAQAQTMTDALAEAYNPNPQPLAQRALLRATDDQVPQALSFWRPTVNFTGQVGLSTNALQTPPVEGVTDRRHILLRPDLLQFQANQPIYRGGRTV